MAGIDAEFNDLLEIARNKISSRTSSKTASQDKDLDKKASEGTLSVADLLLSSKTASAPSITNEDILDALKWRTNASE